MAYMLPQRSQPQLRTLFFTLFSGKPDGQDAPWPSSMRARNPSNFDFLLSRFSSSVAIISSILCQPSGSPSSTVLPPTSSFSRMQLSQISFKSSILAPSSPLLKVSNCFTGNLFSWFRVQPEAAVVGKHETKSCPVSPDLPTLPSRQWGQAFQS